MYYRMPIRDVFWIFHIAVYLMSYILWFGDLSASPLSFHDPRVGGIILPMTRDLFLLVLFVCIAVTSTQGHRGCAGTELPAFRGGALDNNQKARGFLC